MKHMAGEAHLGPVSLLTYRVGSYCNLCTMGLGHLIECSGNLGLIADVESESRVEEWLHPGGGGKCNNRFDKKEIWRTSLYMQMVDLFMLP